MTGQTYSFKKESCTLTVTLFFFELSYLSRFLWDQFAKNILTYRSFANDMLYDVSLYLDVLPFIGLLLFHYKNFKYNKEVNEEPETSTDVIERLPSTNEENEEVVYLDTAY